MLIGREPEERYSVHRGYVDALHALGALPVLVPAGPGADLERCLEFTERVDAVLVSGGGDIEPARYGGETSALVTGIDADRDAVECAVVCCARSRGKRVLGICRGIQVVATALGGSLVTDLPSAGFPGHWDEQRQHQPVHTVTAEPGSCAANALAGAAMVNSIHHQAVADPGPELVATAWSADGLVEAVEADGLLGVQWHPERLFTQDRRHLAPFEWLVQR